ncbi:MAG: hypothetical protein OHK0015_28000 [Chloroflexi bacterium OHK40]
MDAGMRAEPLQDETLPQQPTPLFGRANEVAALMRLLDDPACRLITLSGPGGIGKTRLAIEVAAQVRSQYADGVAFAALQHVPSASLLASAIADALRLPLQGQADAATQLLQALHDRQLLLVLDNFEHLLDGADLLLGILRAAPEVTVIVTSREVLNLREEWLFPVGELELPGGDGEADWQQSSAVQLFVACARRVRRDFDLAIEGPAVAQICRLVAGMPLAIELAAAWAKTLPSAEIAAEIGRNLLFLAANLRDLPERHRSVRAAFDQSWRLLSAAEQRTFRRLAVFRGGFTPDAAIRVAGATLPLLAALVDKSLIRLDSGGRYQTHELLRQYAELHLLAEPDETIATQRAHATYYAEWLYAQELELFYGRRVLDAIAGELKNVRAAWQWATAQLDLHTIQQSAYSVWAYYQQRGPVSEGIATLEQGLSCLAHQTGAGDADALRAQLLVQLGWLYVRQGDLGRAATAFETSWALFVGGGLTPPPGYATDPVLGLARLALWGGNYREAWRLAEEVRQRCEALGQTSNLGVAFYIQAGAARMQGRYRVAVRLAREALALADHLHNDWIKAFCLEELGRIARSRGALEQAQSHFHTCYELRIARGDHQGAAIASDQLGAVMLNRGALMEAHQTYTRTVAELKRLGNRDILVSALNGLGSVAIAQGNDEEARYTFARAVEIAVEIQYGAILPALLASTANLLIRCQRYGQAVELLSFLLRHAASTDETFDLVQRLLLTCEAALAPEAFAVAAWRSQILDLDGAVTVARELLASPIAAPSAAVKPALADAPEQAPVPIAPHDEAPADEPIEQLTRRELEVLRLIGDGLSNQAIADRLVLSHGTIRWYTQQIYGKLGVQSRTQALARARSLQLLA